MNIMHLTTAPVISPIATDLAIHELDAELGRLKAETIRINHFVRKTRWEKYQLIGNTYIWWTDAKEQTHYLSDCYAAANIMVENKQVKTDFRSIMKLISQNQMPEKDLAEWVSCLEFIHHAVKNSPEVFATDRVNDIAHYIEVNGGISGIAQAKGTNKAKSSRQNKPANDGCFTLDEEEFHPCLIDEAKTLHAQQTHLPVINAPGLPLNGEGYGVAVVKQNESGLVFVGAVNDPTYIQDAMFRTYRSDFEALPVTVRAVLEPLHILNEPQVVVRHRGKFIEKSKVVDPWNDKQNLPAAKRLIFRGDHGHFLLSAVGVEASPVVISTPIRPVITGANSDLYLPFNIREEIETKLLDSQSFNLFETSDATQFMPEAGIFGTSYAVKLRTKLKMDDNDGIAASMIERHTLNLHHSPLTFKPFLEFLGDLQQVEPHARYFSPGWTCHADMAFINQLNHAFFFGWIEDLGKYAARDKHKTLSLLLDDKCWVIKHEKGNNGYDQAEVIALPAGMANGLATFEVRSTDLAFVFRQILDLKVIGEITIAANSDAIRIQFKTSANAFDCWIPAVDSAGARRATHFASYVPVKAAKPMPQAAVPCDPDAIDPAYGLDGDDPELDEIIQSIQR
jgi:hypothetical protein